MHPSIAFVLFLAFQTNQASQTNSASQNNPSEQGLKALDEKRYPDAVASLTQAIAADPKDYSLHFNIALAYSLMGKNAEAIPEYKKTLELKPDLYEAELNLSISLLREKRPAEAVLSDRRHNAEGHRVPAKLLPGHSAVRCGRFRQG